MKKLLKLSIMLWLIVPLSANSQQYTPEADLYEYYVLTPISEIRVIEIEREKCQAVRQQLDNYKLLAALNKQALQAHEARFATQASKHAIKPPRKRFVKIRYFTQKHKGKFTFALGFVAGAVITNRINKH